MRKRPPAPPLLRPIVIPRRDTYANWDHANPVLRNRELGLDYLTGRSKIGDGTTAWADLPWFTGSDFDPFAETD